MDFLCHLSQRPETQWQGCVPYPQALAMQMKAHAEVVGGGRPTILGFEHEAVITLGRRGDRAADLLWTKTAIEQAGVGIELADRGGQATLHSPGQLVIYPVLPLGRWKWGVREYVDLLLTTSQALLRSLGVESGPREQPGLYTSKGKIAYLGVRVLNRVSLHGIAINVCNDLSLFEAIRSCGQNQESFDRLANYGIELSTEELFQRWVTLFPSL